MNMYLYNRLRYVAMSGPLHRHEGPRGGTGEENECQTEDFLGWGTEQDSTRERWGWMAWERDRWWWYEITVALLQGWGGERERKGKGSKGTDGWHMWHWGQLVSRNVWFFFLGSTSVHDPGKLKQIHANKYKYLKRVKFFQFCYSNFEHEVNSKFQFAFLLWKYSSKWKSECLRLADPSWLSQQAFSINSCKL